MQVDGEYWKVTNLEDIIVKRCVTERIIPDGKIQVIWNKKGKGVK